jgi:hypothetical protein
MTMTTPPIDPVRRPAAGPRGAPLASLRAASAATAAAVRRLAAAVLLATALPSASAQPLPARGESFDAYCGRLEDASPFVPFRCVAESDWTNPGRPGRTRRIVLRSTDLARAIEVARRLHRLPDWIVVPTQGPAEQTVEDPAKPPAMWASSLQIRRTRDGRPQRIDYVQRAEGSGRTVTVQRLDARRIEVVEISFSD